MKRVAIAVLLSVLPVQSIAQQSKPAMMVVTPLPPHDGDTFKTKEGRTIRMFGIDAPEFAQACKDGWSAGREAQQALTRMIVGRKLLCEDHGRDQYGRWIARCFDGEIDLGQEMVLSGNAW